MENHLSKLSPDIANEENGLRGGKAYREWVGDDIGPLMDDGVPGMGLRTVGEHYFDWRHTEADTLDKVDPVNFRRAVAVLGVTGFILADMEGTLPRGGSE